MHRSAYSTLFSDCSCGSDRKHDDRIRPKMLMLDGLDFKCIAGQNREGAYRTFIPSL
jgi:hypothetical protein